MAEQIKEVNGVKIPSREDIEETREMLEEAKEAKIGVKLEDLTQEDVDSAFKLIDTLSILLMDNLEKLHKIGNPEG